MKKLFIAEKPSVAKAIAGVLKISKSEKGFYETKSGDLVTWCFGHLLEQQAPDAYLPDDIPTTKSGNKIWREQDLPIFPDKWKLQVKSDCKAQFNVIKKLATSAKCDSIVNCGDPDREGQLLVDEVLGFFGNKKPVLRYWSSAVDDASVSKALNSLKPNDNYKGMRYAALGRSHADWLIGMNATRAFTIAASRGGNKTLLAVGRVQTPTLNLVATRDNQIKNFSPKDYYVFKGQFKSKDGKVFIATLQFNDEQPGLDEEKRLIDNNIAKLLHQKFANAKNARVIEFETKNKEKQPPLCYSLADIQSEANSKYGYSAEQILNICQSLYEKHKLTTYPRSDCQYLPTSQFADSPKVLNALNSFHTDLKKFVVNANPKLKSKVWNDSKISAHHGIIPTQQKGELEDLSSEEKNVYYLIVKRYLAQFYPPSKLLSTNITLNVNDHIFKCSGSIILDPGYQVLLGKEESKDEDPESEQTLPKLTKGESVEVLKIAPVTQQTKPPAAFTEGSLIKAMENIYTFVDDPQFKKVLKDGDGIGTSATRAGIIAELKRKGYLALVGKKIKATELGQQFLTKLPELCKNPLLTAMFESQLKLVEAGKITYSAFEEKQKAFTLELVKTASKLTITMPTSASKSGSAKSSTSSKTAAKKKTYKKKFVKKA